MSCYISKLIYNIRGAKMKYFMLMISMLILLSGCGGSSSSDKDDDKNSKYKTLTLGHDGFDFASGTSGGMCDGTTNVAFDVSDGMTASWIPNLGSYAAGEESNKAELTWIHFYNPSTTEYKLVDLGEVSLKSVSNVDVTWPSANSEIKALIVDHVYVIETEDGYAKFKVTDIKNNDCRTVDVIYDFSTSMSFSGDDSTDDDTTNDETDSQSLWFGHFGSDFSEGLGTDSNCSYDGVTIEWVNDDGYLADFTTTGTNGDPQDGSHFWFNVSEDAPEPIGDTSEYYIEYMGNVSLASVTSVSGNWFQRNSTFPALSLDHVYVIKARDGYVKFKVKELKNAGSDICVNVDYVHSPSTTF